jgi:hypothetical protein
VPKKSSTPAPPRKVQAPQRRRDPKRPKTSTLGGGLGPWLLIGAVVAIAVVVAVVFVARGGGSNNPTAA